MTLCTCLKILSKAWASKQYCVWLGLMIQRRWHWRKRKNMLQIATETRFHLGVPATVCSWFFVACPPKRQLLSMSPTLHLAYKNRKSRYVELKEPEHTQFISPDWEAWTLQRLLYAFLGTESKVVRNSLLHTWINAILLSIIFIVSFICLFI